MTESDVVRGWPRPPVYKNFSGRGGSVDGEPSDALDLALEARVAAGESLEQIAATEGVSAHHVRNLIYGVV